MTAPVVTARQAPTGIRLDDGHPTFFAFAADPDVSFWEKTVTPPGMDGGDPVDIVTMHNVRWRTKGSRQLMDLTDCSATVAYDPIIYEQALALVNVETSITIHFPDGTTYSFYGFLRTFEPQEINEGEQPEANITITPTNKDPVTGEEEDPVLVNAAGT